MNILSIVHKLAGSLFKGKGTVIGGVLTTIGLGSAVGMDESPIESIKILVDLGQQAWPHLLVVVGALTTLAGYFRKAGADHAKRSL